MSTSLTARQYQEFLGGIDAVLSNHGFVLPSEKPQECLLSKVLHRNFLKFMSLDIEPELPIEPCLSREALTLDELDQITIECARLLEPFGVAMNYNECFNALRSDICDYLREKGEDVPRLQVTPWHSLVPLNS